jgi:hypothetical protein
MFRIQHLFLSSGEGREAPILLSGPLERANLNHWTNGEMEEIRKETVMTKSRPYSGTLLVVLRKTTNSYRMQI